MKTDMNRLLFVSLMLFSFVQSPGQSIIGTWQLTKQENCIENQLPGEESSGNLADEMDKLSSPSSGIVRFREKGSVEESTRILTKKRKANASSLLYKLSGSTLLILDKKSQTLTETYSVDKISGDSLVLSNSSRPCEIRFFVKIRDSR